MSHWGIVFDFHLARLRFLFLLKCKFGRLPDWDCLCTFFGLWIIKRRFESVTKFIRFSSNVSKLVLHWAQIATSTFKFWLIRSWKTTSNLLLFQKIRIFTETSWINQAENVKYSLLLRLPLSDLVNNLWPVENYLWKFMDKIKWKRWKKQL